MDENRLEHNLTNVGQLGHNCAKDKVRHYGHNWTFSTLMDEIVQFWQKLDNMDIIWQYGDNLTTYMDLIRFHGHSWTIWT